MEKIIRVSTELFNKFFTQDERIAFKVIKGLPKDAVLLRADTWSEANTVIFFFRVSGEGPDEEIDIVCETPMDTPLVLQNKKGLIE